MVSWCFISVTDRVNSAGFFHFFPDVSKRQFLASPRCGPQGTFGDVWRLLGFFFFYQSTATGIRLAETRDAVSHVTVPRTVPTTKGHLAPNIPSSGVEQTGIKAMFLENLLCAILRSQKYHTETVPGSLGESRPHGSATELAYLRTSE